MRAGTKINIGQRGDTIIEVMISILVASSVLGVSLATMNRNLKTSQMNQERTEAYSLAQGQLEQLKQQTESSALTQQNFCFNTSGSIVSITGVPPSDLQSDNFSIYGSSCTFDDRYNVGITRTATRNYTIYVRWDDLSGSKDQVIMSYRTVN